MDFNAVYHRANDNYCYPLNENELIINIKTGYDVKEVNIVQGDPFSAGILGGSEVWSGTPMKIPFKKRLKRQIWWTTTIQPEYKRLKYYFELITENEKYYYFEIKDSSRIAINPDDYKLDKSLKGEFIRAVSADNTLDENMKEKIIACGIGALMGEDLFEA